MIDLQREGEVDVLRFEDGENRFNDRFLGALETALDRVEGGDAAALVTVGTGKFYSTGLDLPWLMGDGSDQAGEFLARVQQLLARVLVFPIPTVAAINGHAFAAGAMLSLAHDSRLMRTDRGFFCLPEIDLATGQPLTPGMTALIGARLPRQSFHEALVTGRRYGGEDAASRGMVESHHDGDDLLAAALERARLLGRHDRDSVVSVKRSMWRNVEQALLAPPA